MDIRIHSSSVLLTTNVLYSAIQARFQSNPTVLVRTVGMGRNNHGRENGQRRSATALHRA